MCDQFSHSLKHDLYLFYIRNTLFYHGGMAKNKLKINRASMNGTQHRARISELIEDHEGNVEKEPQCIRFKVSTNTDQYEETLAHRQALHHILLDKNTEVVWKYNQIVGHQGLLSSKCPDHRGSSYNVIVQWEDESISHVLLPMLATNDVANAVYANDHSLLDTPGWIRFKSIDRVHKKYIIMASLIPTTTEES